MDLENNGGMYYFKSPPLLEKYVIFCSKESDVKVQPAFIYLNHQNEITTPEQRIERIIHFKDDLLKAAYSEDIWNQFYSYYKICLDNDLSYSTFDILRAAGFSSELATKTFVFLLCQDTTENFAAQACKKIEFDLIILFFC